jgi:hypothetical protein
VRLVEQTHSLSEKTKRSLIVCFEVGLVFMGVFFSNSCFQASETLDFFSIHGTLLLGIEGFS